MSEITSLRYDPGCYRCRGEADKDYAGISAEVLCVDHLHAVLAEKDAELAKEREAHGIEMRDRYIRWLCDRAGASNQDELCPQCGGDGQKAYASTALWGGGIGGQAITPGTCDSCWGTGNKYRHGPDLRKAMAQQKENEQLRKRAESAEERLAVLEPVLEAVRETKRRHGTHSCDSIPSDRPWFCPICSAARKAGV